MWKGRKKENYVLEYSFQNHSIIIPFKHTKHLKVNMTSYTDLEMIGLKSANLLCHLSGGGKMALWHEGNNNGTKHNVIEEKYLQNTYYALYLSSDSLYVVKMNTAVNQDVECK